MRKRPLGSAGFAAVGLALLVARPTFALSSSEALGRATTAVQGVEAEIGRPAPASRENIQISREEDASWLMSHVSRIAFPQRDPRESAPVYGLRSSGSPPRLFS